MFLCSESGEEEEGSFALSPLPLFLSTPRPFHPPPLSNLFCPSRGSGCPEGSITDKVIRGGVKLFSSLKHNLFQQFPYSPSQLMGPTMPRHLLLPLPKSWIFQRPPLPSRGHTPSRGAMASRASSCSPRPPPPPTNKFAASASAARNPAHRASPNTSTTRPPPCRSSPRPLVVAPTRRAPRPQPLPPRLPHHDNQGDRQQARVHDDEGERGDEEPPAWADRRSDCRRAPRIRRLLLEHGKSSV
jgi:hypothetical protein